VMCTGSCESKQNGAFAPCSLRFLLHATYKYPAAAAAHVVAIITCVRLVHVSIPICDLCAAWEQAFKRSVPFAQCKTRNTNLYIGSHFTYEKLSNSYCTEINGFWLINLWYCWGSGTQNKVPCRAKLLSLDARNVFRRGALRNPDRPDQILNQAAADKIRAYREPYHRNRSLAFLPA
jgi:hypothetical protein